ncbi:hypothetical protein CDAR_379191 [Caerostris darwini]|uniref:Uncharacterized protein n=1 Tax=Caerostris darwini TaxID=1538125 RepID=A0AAV4R725_9ARAC|nr:hypothetical protein CDAR_379191 [Caerostris darwini]
MQPLSRYEPRLFISLRVPLETLASGWRLSTLWAPLLSAADSASPSPRDGALRGNVERWPQRSLVRGDGEARLRHSGKSWASDLRSEDPGYHFNGPDFFIGVLRDH